MAVVRSPDMMDNQNAPSGPNGDPVYNASTDTTSMQNMDRLTDEKKDHQNLKQQQQTGISTKERIPNNYAPPMQINVSSVNVSQHQPSNVVQQNLSSTPKGPEQHDQTQQQQHQRQPPQQQQPQPQMPPQHPPIKPLLADDSAITIPPQPNTVPNQGQDQKQESLSLQKAVITKVKLSDELNIFDWFRTKEIISQIAEKAKSSVDSVITTLDPGMKEYLYSGGNVNIVVISDSECLLGSIRDAFQYVFGRATVTAARLNLASPLTGYPVRTAQGLEEALKVSQERIKKLRQDTNSVPQNQVVVVVQPTLVSMNSTNNETAEGSLGDKPPVELTTQRWFYTYCMLIEDPVLNVTLNCYSQFIPIDTDIVDSARAVQLPDDFPDKQLGFAGTIGELMAYRLRLNPGNGFGDEYGCFWLREWAGIYETQIIHQLSLTLAQSYRRKWNDCAHLEVVS